MKWSSFESFQLSSSLYHHVCGPDEVAESSRRNIVIYIVIYKRKSLKWRHNERDGISNHRHLDCFLNFWFRHRSKKSFKLRVTGLCVGNSPVAGEVPAQNASNAENVSIWWRHHAFLSMLRLNYFFVDLNYIQSMPGLQYLILSSIYYVN